MIRICTLLTMVTILAACNSKPDPQGEASRTETVELELIEALEAEGRFRLMNQTSQAIVFRSGSESSQGAHPSDAHLKCKPAGSDVWDEGPRPMGDSEATRVEVSPGSEETLIIAWEPGLLAHYAGGRCRVVLRLQNGSIIESSEFSL